MKKKLLLPLMAVFCLASCSDDDVTKEPEYVAPWDIYFLNEGSWGMNDASITTYNETSKVYFEDLYYSSNDKKLGDVAQDIVYGDNHCLYVAVSESRYIAKLDANCKELTRYKTSDTEMQPRSLLLKDGFLYASFYGTETEGGIVAKMDTATLAVVQRVSVGSYPEQIAEINGVIAVCNSGYGYGNTLSMIDVNSFSVKKELALPHMNPQDIVVCNGKFYCNTTEYDESWNSVSRIIEVDPVSFGTKEIAEAFYMCPVGDQMIMIKQSTNYYTTPYTYENTFYTFDSKTGKVTEGKKDETGSFKLYDRGIYGVFCSPDQKKLYVCVSNQEGSAYVNSDVYVLDLNGKQLDVFKAGVLTSKVCFAK